MYTFVLRPSCFNCLLFFFFNDTATTEIYTLSLHDALPIYRVAGHDEPVDVFIETFPPPPTLLIFGAVHVAQPLSRFAKALGDRKSTRLNSSHANISYAVFCLKKKKKKTKKTNHDYMIVIDR